MNRESLFSPTIFQVLLNTPLPTKNITGNIKEPPKKIFAKKFILLEKILKAWFLHNRTILHISPTP